MTRQQISRTRAAVASLRDERDAQFRLMAGFLSATAILLAASVVLGRLLA